MSPNQEIVDGTLYFYKIEEKHADMSLGNQTYLINGMKANLFKGICHSDINFSDVLASCGSENYTWLLYSPLAFCSLKANVTSSMQSSCAYKEPKQYKYSLPNGGFLARAHRPRDARHTLAGITLSDYDPDSADAVQALENVYVCCFAGVEW